MSGRSLRSDLRVAGKIASAQLRDLIRRNDTRRQRAVLVLVGLFVAPIWLSFVQQGYTLGVETREGVSGDVLAIARNGLLPAMAVVALFGALGSAQSLARDAVRPLLLTSASTRAIVIGKVCYLLGTWFVAVFFVAVPVVSYAIGARAPLFLVALVVGLVPLLVLTMTVGLTGAYLLWLGIERLGLPDTARRLITASLSVVAFFVAFGFGISLGRTGEGGLNLPTGDPATPLGWYADILFLGSPVAVSLGARTIFAVGIVLLALPVSFGLLIRIAPAYWYATPGNTTKISGTLEESDYPAGGTDTLSDTSAADSHAPSTAQSPSTSIGRDGRFAGRSPTLRAAIGYVKTARRQPDQFVFLFYYLFPVAALLIPLWIASQAAIPFAIGISLIMVGIWFAGGVFCLNPLGTEGTMLSQLVLAKRPAKTFIHGRLVAGLALGAVIAVLGAIVTTLGLLSLVSARPTTLQAVALAGLGPLLLATLLVTSACFAVGIGAVLPKFETTEVFDSVEALAPSFIAAIIHGLVILGLTVGGVIVALVLTPGVAPSPTPAIAGFAVVLFGTTTLALADGSRRYAIARLRDYGHEPTLDRPFGIYASIGLAVCALLLGQSLALAVLAVVGFQAAVEVLLPLLFVVEYLGAVIVALGFLLLTRRGLAYLDLHWPTAREFGYITAGVIGMFALWAAASAVIAGLGLPSAEHTLIDAEDGDPRLLLLLVPLVVVINGPVEELLYRNVIQKYLAERFSTSVAIVIASVVFALVHIPAYLAADVAGIAVTLVLLCSLSVLLGGLYARTQSLFVVAAVHGLYNAVLLVGLYLAVTSG